MKYFKNYFNANGFNDGLLNDSSNVKFCGKMTMFLLPDEAWEGAISPENRISLIALPIACETASRRS